MNEPKALKASPKLSIYSRASGGGLVVDFNGQLLQIADEKLVQLIVCAVNSHEVAEEMARNLIALKDVLQEIQPGHNLHRYSQWRDAQGLARQYLKLVGEEK